jgi:prepilin-type N-terminal cleavage/methylation domain-containing protein
MGPSCRARGFTLIEAMVVVVLVGVLAVLATLSYRRWVHTTYLDEAQDMVSNIRAAEESFRAENGGYLSISNGLGPSFDYPATTPGRFKTAWGGPCGVCATATQWSLLTIQPSAPLSFGYSLQAGNAPPVGNPNQKPTLSITPKVGGTALDLTNMTYPFYFIEADGDLDGNGVFTRVYGMSQMNRLFIDNEGE